MSNVSWVCSGGPLAPFADGYGAELARLGFTRHSVVTHVVLMGQLSRWMSDAGIVAGDLTEDRVEGFFDARRAGGQNRVPTARTLVPLFGYLRSCGIVPPRAGVVRAPLEDVLSATGAICWRPRAGAVDGGQLRGNSAAVLVGAHADGRRRDRGGGPVRSA